MKVKIVGTVAITSKALAHGVDRAGCAVLQRKAGRTKVTDVMDLLGDRIDMSVFKDHLKIILNFQQIS